MAQWRDGFQGHVSCSLDGPFIALFQQECTDQADNRSFVGEDADDLTAALDVTGA
jgi:hypothetical protein